MTLYRALVGFDYPAGKRDYDKVRSGRLADAGWARHEPEDPPFGAPYPAIVPSWLANGCVEEVKSDG